MAGSACPTTRRWLPAVTRCEALLAAGWLGRGPSTISLYGRQNLLTCCLQVLESLSGRGRLLWRGCRVHVQLPRFEVEYSVELKNALTSLGITRPFNGGDITKVRR